MLANAVSFANGEQTNRTLADFRTNQTVGHSPHLTRVLTISNSIVDPYTGVDQAASPSILSENSLVLNRIRSASESSLRQRRGVQRKHHTGITNLNPIESLSERAKSKSVRRRTLFKKVYIYIFSFKSMFLLLHIRKIMFF